MPKDRRGSPHPSICSLRSHGLAWSHGDCVSQAKRRRADVSDDVRSVDTWKVSELTGAEVSKLPRAQASKLPGAEASKLPGAKTLKLPGAKALKLPGAEALKLPGAEGSKLPRAEAEASKEGPRDQARFGETGRKRRNMMVADSW